MLINLNGRQRAILIFLLSREGPTASSLLTSRYGASLRTVRYDLDAIRAALKGTGLSLATKPRVGVWIDGPSDRRTALVGLLQAEEPPVLSPQEREDRLVLELLSGDKPLALQALSEEMNCSRTTLLRHLPAVERRIRTHGLRLQRTRGQIAAAGTEQARRHALTQLLVETADPKQLLQALRGAGNPEATFPKAAFGDAHIHLSVLADVIGATERSLSRKFTDESYVSLVIHLAVALQRLQKGQAVTIPAARLTDLKERPEWQTAADMAAAIQLRTGVGLSDADLGYLTLHLAGSRAQALSTATNPPPARTEQDPRTHSVVERFIRGTSAALGVDLSGDELLREGLLWHVQGLLTRQQLQVPATNPLRAQIRQQMDQVYTIAAGVAGAMRADLGGQVTEDEITFLTVHLAAALERHGLLPGVRVLVVCSSGLGSAQLLAARLVRAFHEIQIVGVVSALESTEHDWQQKADLIVTTVGLTSPPVPCVQVSPLLSPDEIERVREAMNRSGSQTASPRKQTDGDPIVEELLGIIPAYADVKDREGLRQALTDRLVTGRAPLELIEPILREAALLGIKMEPQAQVGLAIHLQLALPRFRAGQYVQEPDLERMQKEHRSLFRAVERGLELFGRWHGVSVPPDEIIPVMRYILRPDIGVSC